MYISNYLYFFYFFSPFLIAESFFEEFNTDNEFLSLRNIRQMTFSEMGFIKCGEGYFSPDGTKIIFQAVPHGKEHYQIYMMNVDEGLPKMVSTGLGACTCAYFHPNEQKIIFASSHEDPKINDAAFDAKIPGYQRNSNSYAWDFTPYMNIYEANLDGFNLKALTHGPAYSAECAYSPDGARIVFASNRSGSMHIYTMANDGSDIQQVSSRNECYNGGPFFSPDGQQIIFRADPEKPHYLQIYSVDTDGSNEKQLTFNSAVNWAPFWHPSGKLIAFTTSLHGHAHYEIYALSLSNGKQWRITHNTTFDGLSVFDNTGTKMLWTSKRTLDGSCQLFMADFVLPEELQ